MTLTYPQNLKYTQDHEWARRENDTIVIGVTDYAQDELQDIVYVELPEVGDVFQQGDEFGTIESVKVASPLYTPVSGEITEINEALEDAPELVNEAPYGDGWMIKIQMSNPSELDNLLSSDTYQADVVGESEGDS